MNKPTVHARTYSLPNGLTIELGKRTLIMGILNATPDSFSDGGRYDEIGAAVKRAKQMAAEGADIIDVGGESTRPGHAAVPLEEELRRILPIIEAVGAEVKLPISVDTYKAEAARQALKAGASIINDVWGFKREPLIARIAAEAGCPVILMHNRGNKEYSDFVANVRSDLTESVRIAAEAGVEERAIWLDPGIGFAKDYAHNVEIMGRLDEIVSLGFPVLLGTSRKSFIQRTLNVEAESALEGTASTVALGIAQGCQIARVHDVLAMKRVAEMTDAIVFRGNGELN